MAIPSDHRFWLAHNLFMLPPTLTIDRVRDVVVPALRPFASRISLYGSVARNEHYANSDVDVLVDLRPASERPALGLKWFELEHELSETLGTRVELVTERSVSRHIRPYLENDRVVLYEDESGVRGAHPGGDSAD
jgi:uncharacterized protein